ncbi:MAG TPA: amidase family protein [Pseudonocardiaceae bacterium]
MELREYTRLDATGLRELIARGEVSAAEVETVARAAITEANAMVNGLAQPLFDHRLAHDEDGVFGGVPFLLKDGPMAEGKEFFIGSRSLNGIRAQHDSDLMGRFRAAGLAALGVTTMPELGLSFATEPVRHGPTRNPWDLDRGVGGSSGGAAALVAAGAVPMAHANDAAGSIRIPASCCGLVGLKPSRGRTPCGPDSGDPAFGAAVEFAVTRTVRDAQRLLNAVEGPGVGDKYTAGPLHTYAEKLGPDGRSTLRIAISTKSWSGGTVDPEVVAATERVARQIASWDYDVTSAEPQPDWEDVMQAATAECVANAAPFLNAPRRPDPAKLETVSRQILAEADALSAMDLIRMLDAQNRVSRKVGAFFASYDLLITPTLAQLPAPHGTLSSDRPGYTIESWLRALFEYGPFTVPFNLGGQPAISVPTGISQSGLPIGVQLVAGYGHENRLLQFAARLERDMPWADRIAPHAIG